MTGYGRGTESSDTFKINVELKTVNNRFLDINLRLPGELQSLENDIKRAIGVKLSRGRVEVNLQYERDNAVTYELNRPLITGYLSALKELRDEFSLEGSPDINVIARLPNVMTPAKDEVDDEFTSAVHRALDAGLADLGTMRENEGQMLADELSQRLGAIQERLGPIETEAAGIGEEYRQRLNKRISDMLLKSDSQIEIDQGRLAQEVAYLSDRADISEEIARLKAHLGHFREIMQQDKEVGKQLDFLTQELNREANTIASKTGSMIVKENALAIKSEIEKIREQVQNIE
ncbi:MAG: YicC/YloC family endoribonuclease [Acidobacteriota bacterium]